MNLSGQVEWRPNHSQRILLVGWERASHEDPDLCELGLRFSDLLSSFTSGQRLRVLPPLAPP